MTSNTFLEFSRRHKLVIGDVIGIIATVTELSMSPIWEIKVRPRRHYESRIAR